MEAFRGFSSRVFVVSCEIFPALHRLSSPGMQAQWMWCAGLGVSRHGGLSFLTRGWTWVSCIAKWIRNHWEHQQSSRPALLAVWFSTMRSSWSRKTKLFQLSLGYRSEAKTKSGLFPTCRAWGGPTEIRQIPPLQIVSMKEKICYYCYKPLGFICYSELSEQKPD